MRSLPCRVGNGLRRPDKVGVGVGSRGISPRIHPRGTSPPNLPAMVKPNLPERCRHLQPTRTGARPLRDSPERQPNAVPRQDIRVATLTAPDLISWGLLAHLVDCPKKHASSAAGLARSAIGQPFNASCLMQFLQRGRDQLGTGQSLKLAPAKVCGFSQA